MKYNEVENFIAAALTSEELAVSPAYGHSIYDAEANCAVALKGDDRMPDDYYTVFDIDVMYRTEVTSDPERDRLFNGINALRNRLVAQNWNIAQVAVEFASDADWHGAILNFKLHERFDV